MEKRINVVWKVVSIVIFIALSFIPLYFMQQYVQSLISEQNSLVNLASQSANYISGLVESAQGQDIKNSTLDLKENYLFTQSVIGSAPLTLGLAFLLLLLVDVVKSSLLSLVNYFIVGIGLILFYLIVLVLARYVELGFAYFVPAIICSLLFSIYLSSSLNSMVTAMVYGIGLLIIYAFAFYLIRYVDNMLMYGAVCLFIVFVAIIIMTRKINWNSRAEVTKGSARKLN